MKKRHRFFLDGILLTAVALAMRTVQLFFSAYVSRRVGAEGVGLYSLIMTVYSFALTLATSGISLTVTRLVAGAIGEGSPREVGRILRGATVYSLLFGALATLGLTALSGVIGEGVIGDGRSVYSLRILALSLIPSALTATLTGYFVGVRRVAANASVQVLGQIFKIVLTVYLLGRISGLGVGYAVVALALGSTLTDIVCFLVVLGEFILDRALTRVRSRRGVSLRPVAGMALPLGLSAYVRSALLSLEHSLIPKKLEGRGESRAEALSSYGSLHGMALPMVLYPMSPLSSFAGLLVPEFAESEAVGNRRRMERIASEAMNRTLSYATAVAVLIYLFSEEIGYTVYSSYDAGRFIAMLAPIIPIMYLDHVADSILKGIGEQVFSMWVNIADATLSVILVCLLIPIFGISGYALVIIGMEVFNFALSAARLRRRIHFGIDLCRALLLPAISAALASLISRALLPEVGAEVGVRLLVMKLVFAASAYFAVYIPLSAISGPILRGVSRLVRRKNKLQG